MLAFDMAGGPLAQEIWCFECYAENRITKAVRVYEGAEDDHYRCERGHEFGVDYRKGPVTEAQWPPPKELVASVTEN